MLSLFPKALGIWLIIVIIAIVNAALREKLLAPMIGSEIALPVSGLLLSICIVLVAIVPLPFFNSSDSITYIFIGAAWFVLTLSFEFLFGHFVVGKSWHEIMQVFNNQKAAEHSDQLSNIMMSTKLVIIRACVITSIIIDADHVQRLGWASQSFLCCSM